MMHMADVVRAIAEHRGDAIVIPGRSGRYWAPISDTAFDLPLGDPAMGGHAGFGLGVALAQPDRRVVLLDSEGDILMSLGMLATIAEQAPANFYHFVLDNEVYATTGGQPVPNAKNVAYDVLARGAGYPRAFAFTELDAFTRELPGFWRAGAGVRRGEGAAGDRERADQPPRALAEAHRDKVVQDLRKELGVGQSIMDRSDVGQFWHWRCGRARAERTGEQRARHFVTANNSAYDTLDPHVVFDIGRIATRLNMYDCLVRWVDNPPKLATVAGREDRHRAGCRDLHRHAEAWREVPRWRAGHRRRRGVLDGAHPGDEAGRLRAVQGRHRSRQDQGAGCSHRAVHA